MSNIADKLNDLIAAKADMKSAIESKGVTITGGLSTYADAIRSIESGSGGGTTDDIRFYRSALIEISINGDLQSGLPTIFSGAFMNCINLIKITGDITNKSTYLYQLFKNCGKLEDLNVTFDTSNVISMAELFFNCKKLKSIPELDCSKLYGENDIRYAFYGCNSLTSLGGLKNLRFSVDLGDSPISAKSAFDVVNNLDTVSVLDKRTITFSEDTYINMITDSYYDEDEVTSIATKKGWVVNIKKQQYS